MSKHTALLGAVGTLLTAAFLAASLVPAFSQQQGGTQTIVTCDKEKDGFSKDVDVGKKGFSPGDFAVFTEPLLNPDTGDRIGKLLGQFQFIRKTGRRNGFFRAEATAIFQAGRLNVTFGGKFSEFETGLVGSIDGGTGDYRQASGTVTIKEGTCAGDPGARATFEIVLQ